MVRTIVTTNRAVAEAAKLSNVNVVPVYPITPATSIAEYLAKFVADGEMDAEYVRVESEHSAMSVAIGASSTGARVFTATSSQGLALMHEVLFIAAGMRAPIVMANANRALSAPLSIWNDQQDSISERDSGWIQIYAENAQEALDYVIQSYRIAEHPEVLLPTMVCLDGFILTHTVETVDIPGKDMVSDFVSTYKPTNAILDPENPMSIGTFTDPNYYMEARHDMYNAMINSKKIIKAVNQEFGEIFKREYEFVENYRCDDAEIIIVAMGSVCGTVKDVIDEVRREGEKVGLLKLLVYRPFPKDEIGEVLKNTSKVAVLDKNISFDIGGALYNEIKAKLDVDAYGFILGLGGRDVTPEQIRKIIKETKKSEIDVQWIGLKKEEI